MKKLILLLTTAVFVLGTQVNPSQRLAEPGKETHRSPRFDHGQHFGTLQGKSAPGTGAAGSPELVRAIAEL